MKKKVSFQNMQNREKGFTLIELLLVVIIIGILSGIILSVINVAGIRAKARDSQRSGDLERIALALELYYQDHRVYPNADTAWWRVSGSNNLTSALEPTYINNMPSDPLDDCTAGDPCACSTDNHAYYYTSTAGGGAFVLATTVEVESSNDNSQCSDLNNWAALGCGAGINDICYGIESPF